MVCMNIPIIIDVRCFGTGKIIPPKIKTGRKEFIEIVINI